MCEPEKKDTPSRCAYKAIDPMKPKESLYRRDCARKRPPKGVGGPIVESIELKRSVSETRRGIKVFDRTIEEKQTPPGQATIRIGSRTYYLNEKGNEDKNDDLLSNIDNLDCQLGNLDKQLREKSKIIKKLDDDLNEKEKKLALLDCELEKLDIIGEAAIEEAVKAMEQEECELNDLTDETLDLLLNPSVQMVIEESLTIPDIDLTCSKPDLKELCKQYCKEEFAKLEKGKSKQQCKENSCPNISEISDCSLGDKNKSCDPCNTSTRLQQTAEKTRKLLDEIEKINAKNRAMLCSPIGGKKIPSCGRSPIKKPSQALCVAKPRPAVNACASKTNACASKTNACALKSNACASKQFFEMPPLFSRLIKGIRCFPDIEEISKSNHNLYMTERDAYVIFSRQLKAKGRLCEKPGEFEQFFYNYLNGKDRIHIEICPGSKSNILPASFIPLTKLEIDSLFKKNVKNLGDDFMDREPDVLAHLLNARIPPYTDPEKFAEQVTPHQILKSITALDSIYSEPGSLVPNSIPVFKLNIMNNHVLDSVEAMLKSYEIYYPMDYVATADLTNLNVKMPSNRKCGPYEQNYKCKLELHPFRVETTFQLRGFNSPSWFPGMFTAYPDGESCLHLVRSPSHLINTAWRLCSPNR